jgi:hypothetical protein
MPVQFPSQEPSGIEGFSSGQIRDKRSRKQPISDDHRQRKLLIDNDSLLEHTPQRRFNSRHLHHITKGFRGCRDKYGTQPGH